MRSGLESQHGFGFAGGMPRRNSRDRSRVGAHHVYNRGTGGCLVFIDDADRREFLGLMARSARLLEGRIGVTAYCLMGTHFHLVLWQKDGAAMRCFMSSLMTAYVKYFNHRHGRTGPLFAGPFRSRHLPTSKQFKWVIGYVHDNHPSGVNHQFSSHRAYIDERHRPPWLTVESALRQFGDKRGYARYLANRDTRNSLQSEFFDQ